MRNRKLTIGHGDIVQIWPELIPRKKNASQARSIDTMAKETDLPVYRTVVSIGIRTTVRITWYDVRLLNSLTAYPR